MNKRKTILRSTLLVLAMLLSAAVQAQQTKVPEYKIMCAVETNARALFTDCPQWGFQNLRQNIRKDISRTDSKSIALPSPSKQELTPQQLYQQRQDAALMFCKTYTCGQCPELHVSIIATATPITADGVCLANYHMIHPIVSGDEHLCKGDSVYFVADRDGMCYPLTSILAYSKYEDMACFRVDTQGGRLSAIPLGQPAEVGQNVSIISHPKNILYSYSRGYVTRNVIYTYPDSPVMDIMDISAEFAEGSSGGPIMDDCGNLVGMVRGTRSLFHDEARKNPQMTHRMTIPVSALRKLIGR